MLNFTTPKTALERIGVGKNRDDRRTNLDKKSREIREALMDSNSSRIQEDREQQRQKLIENLATNINVGSDFSSLDDAGSFVDELQSRRNQANQGDVRSNNQLQGAPGETVDYSGLDPNLQWLIDQESDGRTSAKNPKSSAFGLGQLIEANRVKYGSELGYDPNTTEPNEQLQMMLAYIRDRYGTVEEARRFWEANGWY